MITRLFSLLLGCSALAAPIATGQSPEIVVQAATPAAATASKPVGAAPVPDATIRLLQEIKTANEETLKKQQAALEQLEELRKLAEQIKIFAHRG